MISRIIYTSLVGVSAFIGLGYILPVTAMDVAFGEMINITNPIAQNYYIGGSKVVIDTTLDRDVRGFASHINIGGAVKQDLQLLGSEHIVRADIGGDARIIGEDVKLFGSVSGDLIIIAESVEIGNNVLIGGDVMIYAQSIIYNGQTQGSLYLNAGSLIYNGSVVKGAIINTQSLIIQTGSLIVGDLQYRMPKKNPALEAIVIQGGKISYYPGLQPYNIIAVDYAWTSFSFLYWLCVILVFSLIGYGLLFHRIQQVSYTIRHHLTNSFLLGIALVCVLPVVSILLIISIIGIPLGIIGLMILRVIRVFSPVGVVLIGTRILSDIYFTGTNFKHQLARLCILISLVGIVSILGWLGLVLGMAVVGGVGLVYLFPQHSKKI